MPKCLNDPKKSYKGTEPSPKGLGYCAGGMKVGEKKKGKDGNMWSVKKVKNGSKRWIKERVKYKIESTSKPNCKDFVLYKKETKGWFNSYTKILFIKGLKGPDKDTIYKFISYNKFEDKPTKIPKGYKKSKVSSKHVKNYYCGSKKFLQKNNEEFKKIKHTGYKRYYTHNNGGREYLVYLGKKDAYIYEKPQKIEINWSNYSRKDDDNKWMYIKLVKHVKFIKAFIGNSPVCKMTKFSGGIGKSFDGNSILLQTSKNKYVYIGSMIEDIEIDDQVIRYYSPVGNNDVPYPYAIGKKYIMSFVYPYGYISKKYFSGIGKGDRIYDYKFMYDYDPFFIPFGKKKSKSKLTLEEFKEIQKKKLDDISLQTVKTLAKMFTVTSSGSKKTLADRILKLRGVKIYSD